MQKVLQPYNKGTIAQKINALVDLHLFKNKNYRVIVKNDKNRLEKEKKNLEEKIKKLFISKKFLNTSYFQDKFEKKWRRMFRFSKYILIKKKIKKIILPYKFYFKKDKNNLKKKLINSLNYKIILKTKNLNNKPVLNEKVPKNFNFKADNQKNYDIAFKNEFFHQYYHGIQQNKTNWKAKSELKSFIKSLQFFRVEHQGLEKINSATSFDYRNEKLDELKNIVNIEEEIIFKILNFKIENQNLEKIAQSTNFDSNSMLQDLQKRTRPSRVKSHKNFNYKPKQRA